MRRLYVIPNTGLTVFRGIEVLRDEAKVREYDALLSRHLSKHRPTERSGLLDWCTEDRRKTLDGGKTPACWLPIGEDEVDHQHFVRPYREGATLRTDVCIDTSDAFPTSEERGFVLTVQLHQPPWWRRRIRDLTAGARLLDLCEVVVLGQDDVQGKESFGVSVREYHAALDFGNTSCAIGLQSIFEDEEERVVELKEWLGARLVKWRGGDGIRDKDVALSASSVGPSLTAFFSSKHRGRQGTKNPSTAQIPTANADIARDLLELDLAEEHEAGNLDTNISIVSGSEPVWAAMGGASRNIKHVWPTVTRVTNPKKYIRCYEKREHEEAITFRGLADSSAREPISRSVDIALRRLLQILFEHEMRPSEGENHPGSLPLLRRIHGTFPLLWRDQERELFAKKVRRAVEEGLQDLRMEPPTVELAASEPEAVAAYFFSEIARGLDSAGRRSVLDCLRLGDRESEKLRALFVDLGGGTTDTSLVECRFVEEGNKTRCATTVCGYERIGRAGDRVTHLMVVRLLAYLFNPNGRIPNLDYRAETELTGDSKNTIVGILLDICETLKRELSEKGGRAVLDPNGESWKRRLNQLRSLGLRFGTGLKGSFEIRSDELLDSLARDIPAARVSGRQGFGDVFTALRNLYSDSVSNGQPIHLCVLSGRTSRLHGLADAITRHSRIPRHRIFRIGEFLPMAGDGADKFAVVSGALRFAKGAVVQKERDGTARKLAFDIGLRSEERAGFSPVWAHHGEAPGRYNFTLDPTSEAVIAVGTSERKPCGVARVYNSNRKRVRIEVEAIDAYNYKLIEPTDGNVELVHLFPGTLHGGDNLADSGRIDCEEGLRGFLAQLG